MDKVLIVEDDPMVASINKKYLQRIMPCEIYGPVMTEEEIIRFIQDKNIDLILMDEYLPQKNGLEILKCLRGRGIVTQVIMITAANHREELQKAYAYGVIDYLVKPFELKRFEKAIHKYYKFKDLFKENQAICQHDIDEVEVHQKCIRDLPKGLNKLTLKRIIEVLSSDENEEWTLRRLAKEIKSSNVTVKKYMDYLEETGEVQSYLTSGQIGRPEYRYKIKTGVY